MNTLTCQEQRLVQRLMNTGYAHAAQAFSALIHQKVSSEMISFGISTIGILDPTAYPNGSTTLLLTDILGEVGGRSYLILSEQECWAIQAACLPTMDDSHQRTDLDKALLEEIDNILSAAVITKLSEALGVHIYGGVPQLFALPPESVKKKIREDFSADKGGHLMVSGRFIFDLHPHLQPQFLWKLSANFLQRLEEYIHSAS